MAKSDYRVPLCKSANDLQQREWWDEKQRRDTTAGRATSVAGGAANGLRMIMIWLCAMAP